MSKNTPRHGQSRTRSHRRNIRIRGTLRTEPDLNRIARTVLAVALAQAEKEAQQDVAQPDDDPGVDHE